MLTRRIDDIAIILKKILEEKHACIIKQLRIPKFKISGNR